MADAAKVTLTCSSGALGKCVRFGYAPWRRAPGGTSLDDAFNACIRMVRADYCGDGKPHTRQGTMIDVVDRWGIRTSQSAHRQGFQFEAAWGPAGALCVAHTRLPDLLSLDRLLATCPRLAGHLGRACAGQQSEPEAILFNASP